MVEMVTPLRPRLVDAAVVGRLRRIEGQACALNRMYGDGRSAEDLADQIAALHASSRSARAVEASTLLLQRLVRP